MFEIINTQDKIAIKTEDYKSLLSSARELIPETEGRSISFVFISDEEMKQLNEMFRNKPTTTDVLSFPTGLEDFENPDNTMGEVVISVEQAQKQARENKISLELEIKQLLLHGVLHLSGYDHETDSGKMNSFELDLRDKLGINK